jgi:uncharacterized protein (DUF934 family)
VHDNGFTDDDWTQGFITADNLHTVSVTENADLAVDLPNSADLGMLVPWLDQIDLIRIEFPNFTDGRGFSLARQLRMMGFQGRLRAVGQVLPDQYAMVRRCGFDEVEIDKILAARQPERQWQARADWRSHDYQNRLRQIT